MKYKYCLYARKSTESDEKQALSIESQVKEMLAIAERDDLKVVEIKRESHSAKNSGERPVFNELIQDLKADKIQGILTWQTDRLSRNAGDLGIMVDLIDQKRLVEIRTYNQVFTNSPNDKFLLMILGSQAKLENDNRAINVVRGMKTKCEMGIRPCMTPLGYLNDPIHAKGMKEITLDPVRAPIIKKMFEMSASGVSGRKIIRWADINGFRTRAGRPLSINGLLSLLSNTYYYGKFEWPIGGGNWYDVNHKSIITKELFDKVQMRFKSMPKYPEKKIEFNFTGVMRCGVCGCSVVGVKKFKNLTNGKREEYNYYMCAKYTRHSCKQRPISEVALLPQLIDLMDGVKLDKFLLKTEYEYEVKRFHKFTDQLSGKSQKEVNDNVDIRSQMKYILQEGSVEDKKRLLKNIGSKIILKDKLIFLK
jgi:DNA invertase Pin-like site-specific DNA recombinase